MEAPVRPIEPGQRPEDEDMITHAMALAIVEIKKHLKEKVCLKTTISTWRGARGEISISVPGDDKAWKEYQVLLDKYREDTDAYEAEQHGVSVQLYQEAKQKLNKYNQKKCDKAPDKSVADFLQDMIELPDEDEIIIAS